VIWLDKRIEHSIATLEDSCVVERKDLSDLVHAFTAGRPVFVNRLRLMSAGPKRLLVITAALSTMKSSYASSDVNLNHIMRR
jgi:ERCC4-type nuclease